MCVCVCVCVTFKEQSTTWILDDDRVSCEWILEFSIKQLVNATGSRFFIALYIKHPTCKSFKSNTFKMLLLLNRNEVCDFHLRHVIRRMAVFAYKESV